MKKRLITRHPVAELASLLLFGIFVFFIQVMFFNVLLLLFRLK